MCEFFYITLQSTDYEALCVRKTKIAIIFSERTMHFETSLKDAK